MVRVPRREYHINFDGHFPQEDEGRDGASPKVDKRVNLSHPNI